MSYIIITPAHNEADLIRRTIDSVMSQTVLPHLWLIVDDCSSDATPAIIREYEATTPWLRHLRLERGAIQTYYARRTHVFLEGYDRMRSESFEFLAALDADIELPPHYYEQMLATFCAHPEIGIVSGVYLNVIDGIPHSVLRDPEAYSTPGGIQVFRRAVYEQIGGYKPLPFGGDDSLANIEAQMHGWRTRALPECKALHYRPVGTRGGTSMLKVRYRQGLADHALGSHPLFMLVKSLRRMAKEPPLLIGSMARMAGYLQKSLMFQPHSVPPDVVRFVREHQMRRLQRVFALWETD